MHYFIIPNNKIDLQYYKQRQCRCLGAVVKATQGSRRPPLVTPDYYLMIVELDKLGSTLPACCIYRNSSSRKSLRSGSLPIRYTCKYYNLIFIILSMEPYSDICYYQLQSFDLMLHNHNKWRCFVADTPDRLLDVSMKLLPMVHNIL